jgi:hypothetical protein
MKHASGDSPDPTNRKGMTIMASTLFKLAGGLALLVAATLVQAQDIHERTIRFGHLNNQGTIEQLGVKDIRRARGRQERRLNSRLKEIR